MQICCTWTGSSAGRYTYKYVACHLMFLLTGLHNIPVCPVAELEEAIGGSGTYHMLSRCIEQR